MKTKPGTYYGITDRGRLVELGDVDAPPNVVICRRLADFPGGRLPAGGFAGGCTRCGATLVFNPAGPHQDRPRVCMQCADIEPLPLP